MTKVSIRFFNDREVRAVWDESTSQWFFAAVDIVAVLNERSDYTRNRNYWKYLKNKLKQENPQLVSAANQLKLTAPDGKKRLTDCFDSASVIELRTFRIIKRQSSLIGSCTATTPSTVKARKRLTPSLKAACFPLWNPVL